MALARKPIRTPGTGSFSLGNADGTGTRHSPRAEGSCLVGESPSDTDATPDRMSQAIGRQSGPPDLQARARTSLICLRPNLRDRVNVLRLGMIRPDASVKALPICLAPRRTAVPDKALAACC